MAISYAEFLNLPVEKQAVVLDELRREYGVGKLVKTWGISTSKLYKLIHDLNLPVSKRGRKPVSKTSSNIKPVIEKKPAAASRAVLPAAPTKLTFSLTAEGDGDALLRRIQPLLTAISSNSLNFKVSIIAEEI